MARLELIVDPAKAKQGFRDAGQASDRYRRGAKQATDQTGKVRGAFQKLSSAAFSLKGAIVGLGIGAVAGTMTRLTTQSIAATAAISEQADVAGIGAERFQELTKAFADLGGAQESVTSGALRRFNRRFGLAQEGMGAANKTLDRLNISLEQGTGPALDEAIRKLANMENAANRTAEASQLFGEDAGPRLAAVLAQGTGAIDSQIERLREQGRVLDNETVANARAANDALSEISDTLSADFNRLVAENASQIAAMAESLSDVAESGFDAAAGLVEFGQNMQFARDEINDFNTETIGGVNEELEKQRDLLNEIENSKAGQEGLLGDPEQVRRNIQVLEARRSLLERDLQQQAIEDIETNTAAFGRMSEAAEEAADGGLTDLQKAFGLAADEAKNLDKEARKVIERQSEFDSMFSGFLRDRAESDVTSNVGAFGNLGSDEQNQSLDDTSRIMDRIDRQMKSMNQTGKDLGMTFTSAFEDAVIEGENFRDVLQGALKDISRIILRRNVTEPAAKAIGNFDWSSLFTNDSSMGAGTGSSPAIASGGSSYAGGGYTGDGARSGGLDGRGGFLAMMHPRESVIDHTKGGGGGVNLQVNVINEGGERLEKTGQRERRGPNGERQMDVLVKSSIQRLDSGGELDGVFRRHGANRQGQF